MAKMASTTSGIYQLKITLEGIRPPIWRRIQVKDCTLAKLHDIIQDCMGWFDGHLHEFRVGRQRFGPPDPDDWSDTEDSRRMKLSQVVAARFKKLSYTYDFGDNWEHSILVEKQLPAEAGVHYPRCLADKRACPPEDCGGVWGYEELLEILRDPNNPEHAERLEWLGDNFDPEAFDIEATNQKLRET